VSGPVGREGRSDTGVESEPVDSHPYREAAGEEPGNHLVAERPPWGESPAIGKPSATRAPA